MGLAAIGTRVRFLHVALAFLAALASALALRTWALPRMEQLAANKAYFDNCDAPCLFDARPHGYTFAEAKAYLDALGPDARAYYAHWYLPFYDLAFPVSLFAFGLLFCLWMTQHKRRFAVHLGLLWRLVILLIPIALFSFDLLENASVLAMLKSYPHQASSLVTFASFFSQAKWLAAYLAAGLGVALLLLGTSGWWRRA